MGCQHGGSHLLPLDASEGVINFRDPLVVILSGLRVIEDDALTLPFRLSSLSTLPEAAPS
jgi:hypothetical protein